MSFEKRDAVSVCTNVFGDVQSFSILSDLYRLLTEFAEVHLGEVNSFCTLGKSTCNATET